MTTPDPRQPDRRPASTAGIGGWAAVGGVALAVLCCAGPVLIAAGALGALGAFLRSPLVLATAGIVFAAAVIWVLARRRGTSHSGGACCPPKPPASPEGEMDRLRGGDRR